MNMMSASAQGALAFQKGLGCVHSLSHSLGGVDPRLHHGTLNAMFLPTVIRFNAGAESVQREHRMQRMAYAMGLGAMEDAAQAAEALAQAILAMTLFVVCLLFCVFVWLIIIRIKYIMFPFFHHNLLLP